MTVLFVAVLVGTVAYRVLRLPIRPSTTAVASPLAPVYVEPSPAELLDTARSMYADDRLTVEEFEQAAAILVEEGA